MPTSRASVRLEDAEILVHVPARQSYLQRMTVAPQRLSRPHRDEPFISDWAMDNATPTDIPSATAKPRARDHTPRAA